MVLREISYRFRRRAQGDRGSLSLNGFPLAVLAGVVVAEALVALVSMITCAFLLASSGIEGQAQRDVL